MFNKMMRKFMVLTLVVGFAFISDTWSGDQAAAEQSLRARRVYINSAPRRKRVHVRNTLKFEQKKVEKPSVFIAQSDNKKSNINKKLDSKNHTNTSQFTTDEDLEINQVVALAKKTEDKINNTLLKIDEIGDDLNSLSLSQKSLVLKNRKKLIDQTRVLVQMREEISQTIVSLDPSLDVLFDSSFDSRAIARRLSKFELLHIAQSLDEEVSTLSTQVESLSIELDSFTSDLRKDVDQIKSIAALRV